jgi:hypothetical protein
MADGSTKAIEDVQVGDLVMATDPKTGEAGGRMVIALIVGQGDKDLVEVTVDTDDEDGDDTGTVIATDGHPFWVENLGAWVDAKDLQPGDMLRTSAGTWVQVTATREFQRHQRVHNLTVTDIHTYHVTASDTQILVHNTNSCTPLSQETLDTAFSLANTHEKLDHVIDPVKHGFGDLVKATGSRSAAMRSIVDSLRCTCGLPASGRFEVDRLVHGETVTIRGAMVNGVPRIGTAFIRSKFPGVP